MTHEFCHMPVETAKHNQSFSLSDRHTILVFLHQSVQFSSVQFGTLLKHMFSEDQV